MKIRSNILTEGNIRDLVKGVAEEMDGVTREQRKRLETIEDELEEVKRKLGRIWHFIETSDAVMADASDRIREHRERQEHLEYFAEQARAVLAQRRKVLDDANAIAAYAREMKDFLEGERVDRAQGLHRDLYQGDRRRARRRPAQIHSPYARRQLDTWESRRKGGPERVCSIYFTRWWAKRYCTTNLRNRHL